MKNDPLKFVLKIVLVISVIATIVIAAVFVYIKNTEPKIVSPEGFKIFQADNFYFFYPEKLTLYTPDTTATYPVDKSKMATYLGQLIELVFDDKTGEQIVRPKSDGLKIAFVDLGEMTFEEYMAKENAIREKEDDGLPERSVEINTGEYKGESHFENFYAKWNITIDYIPNIEKTQVVVIEATVSPEFKKEYEKMLETLKFRESIKSKLNISDKLVLEKSLARIEDQNFPFNFYYPNNLSYCLDNGSILVVPNNLAINKGEECSGGIAEENIYIYASYGKKINSEGLTLWTENYSTNTGVTFELIRVLSNFKIYFVASASQNDGSFANLVFQNIDRQDVIKMLDLVKFK